MTRPDTPAIEGVDLDGLTDYLDDADIVFAVLFGSHARGETDPSSDVDIALRFPETLDETERFHRRNRIDAELQEYADGFVDVSDIARLPIPIAYRAIGEGVLLSGDEDAAQRFQKQVTADYERTARERERERDAFIGRLARGDL